FERIEIEVDPGLRDVGNLFFDEAPDLSDDLRDVGRGPGIVTDSVYPKGLHVPEVFGLEPPCKDGLGGALLACTVDDLVIHVRDVLEVEYFFSSPPEVLCKHVEDHVGPGMTQVRIIVDCRTTDKERHPVRVKGFEWLNGP